jgi:rhodanese-related sulfurtransferase
MEIDNKIINQWIQTQRPFLWLDVRTLPERDMASLGGLHIPIQEIENRFSEIPYDKRPLIVYCHHGVRSLYVAQFLKLKGFDALSLRGGIDSWSIDIDPSIPRY